MSKITSKLQVTIPKAIAERYGLRPGDEITFEPADDVIRVVPPGRRRPRLDLPFRLRMLARSNERQRAREAALETPATARPAGSRGWTRDQLYRRGDTD